MGKKIVDEDMNMNITINGDKGKKALYELEERVKDLNSENEKLERSLQSYEKQIASNEKTIDRYNRTLEKEAANQSKQEKIHTDARSRLTELHSTYRQMDSAAKESSFGKKIHQEMTEVEDAVRKSGAAGRNSVSAQDALRKSIGKLTAENEKLTKKRVEDTAVLDKNKAAVHEADTKIASMRKNLDITTLSIDDLNKEITHTNSLFRSTDPNDPKWKEYQATLTKLRTQHQKLSSQAQSTKGVLCKMADGVNKYWNFVVSGMASLTGVVLGVKGAIDKYVRFTDVLADVRKTTGLTEQGVLELNDSLKKIDTRTAQEELMGLSRIGGKLGIEGKDDLEGFTRAADKINVALKEDLGGDTEEAINQVGKLVDIFKVKETYGIEQGMLKVGSVINELGAASTANEGYIVEFSKRVAGVAPSAGVGVSAVMGLAATLDQFGQQSEVSSTVYSQVMTGMFKKTGEYAKVAGMDVASFSSLLKTDANEAFVRVLEGLKGNNAGMEQLVANMGDLGVDGTRAVTVLGTLANNTGTLRAQQILANDAFREGTSLTNEFNIKNTNLAAQADKAKKILNERIIDLGEKLQPALTLCTSSMSMMVNVLGILTGFLAKYGSTILWAATTIGFYTAGLKAKNVLMKLSESLVLKAIQNELTQTAAIKGTTAAKLLLIDGYKKAIIAVKAFGKAMMSNPWGLAATLVLALGVGMYKLFTHTTEAEKAMKRVADANRELEKGMALEQMSIDRLFGALKGATKGTKEYDAAKSAILSKYGQYLSGLDDEVRSLNDVKTAYEAISKAATQAARDRAVEAATTKANEEYVDIEIENLDKIKTAFEKKFGTGRGTELFGKLRDQLGAGGDFSEEVQGAVDKFNTSKSVGGGGHMGASTTYVVNDINSALGKIRKGKEAMEMEINDINTLLGRGIKYEFTIPDAPEVDISDITSPGKQPVKKTAVDTPAKAHDFESEILALKQQYAQKSIAKEAYESKLDTLELGHLQYRLANENNSETEKVKLKQQIADKMISVQQKLESVTEVLREVEKAKQLLSLKKELDARTVTKEQYDRQALELDLKFLNAQLANKSLTDKERVTLEQQRVDKEMAIKQKAIEESRLLDELSKGEALLALKQKLIDKTATTETYEIETAEIELSYLKKKLATEQLYGKDELALKQQIADKELDITNKKQKALENNDKISKDKELLDAKQQLASGTISKITYDSKVDDIDRKYLVKQRDNAQTPEEKNNVESKIADKDIKAKDDKSSIRSGLGLSLSAEDLQLELDTLNTYYEQGIISHSEYEQQKTEKTKKQNKERQKLTESGLNAVNSALSAGANIFSMLKEKELAAAGDNEAKKEEIRKKYAKKEQAVAIAQAVTNGALAIMQIWAGNISGNPIVDAIIKGVLTAAQVAQNVVQISTIKSQQFEKGRYPVIGADDGQTYDAEYTDSLQTGVYNKPTLGLFSEKKPELVVDGATTRKLVFDYPAIYNSILDVSRGRTPQFAQGRYPSSQIPNQQDGYESKGTDLEMKKLLQATLETMAAVRDKDISIPWYGTGGLSEMMKKAARYENQTKL